MPACVCAYECTSVPVNVVFARWCFMGRCWCKSVTRKCKTWRAIEQVRVFYCCTCVLICAALVCALQCWCKCVTRKCKTWRTVTLVCMCMRISTCQYCVCSCCFLLGDVGVRVSHESARHEGQSRNVCVYECTSVPISAVFAHLCFMGRCWCKSVTRKCETWRAIKQACG